MEENKLQKIIYEDGGRTKIIKCYILKEDEFIYEVEALGTQDKIIIGKRAIIKISEINGGDGC